MSMNRIKENMPVLFVSGLYVKVQSPERFAENVLQSCLYTDGYFAWYGTALLSFPGPGEEKQTLPGAYGRWGNSSAADYLGRPKATHTRLDTLLTQPRDTWPKRIDGKLRWLRDRMQAAEAQLEANETAQTRQAVQDAAKELNRYMQIVAQGGY